jgi:hypothetical protein
MKSFIPVLALAAGVSATFKKAPIFSFPGNTDNVCTDKQKPGFNWDDLDFGDFFDYKDFNFKGWKCEDDGDSRGRFAPRTGRKAIGGVCSSDKKKSPSFGCGARVDKFSLGSIHVKPEFDCDLEFHYDMPDGSSCKHRSPCRKSGTTVVNRQCGGAKNVTIVYPPQPNKPKPSCSIKVPTISFDCDTASSTKPPKTKTKTPPATTAAPPVKTTAATSEVEEPSTTPAGESSSSPPAETETKVVPGVTTTSTGAEATSSVAPGQETSTTVAEESSTTVAEENSTTVAEESSTTAAEENSTTVAEESSTTVAEEGSSSVPPVTKTITTSYDSTSTIFSTSTQTITQCEPTIADCPADSVTTTVVTVAVSTTICPVTETLTTVETTPAPTPATSTVAAGTSDAVVTSAKPVETLPCPSVVPSCLNTFIFDLGCTDNTDAECYCPDAKFVKNVYDCLYAHGETDAIISEAVAYFQGICGKWVEENPAIATCATITTYITVTATPTVAPVYSTVFVDVTTVVPCTDEAGEVIPSSSTTVTVSTSMTVPQVDFTTGPAGGVEIIPITEPAATESLSPITSSGPSPVVTANGTTIGVPTGTASLFPTNSIVTAGVSRVGASFGLAAAVAFVAAVAL